MNMEEPYFWMLKYLRYDIAYRDIIKTEDTFTAAENSAFFGVSQLRIGGQQDKVSQFLATIGKMIKELFQLVRELRILDERIDYYKGSMKEMTKGMYQRKKSDDITLKGIFIDMVQGGAKNPASVYGMARELQFTTLPDLFFNAPPMKRDEVDDYVDRLEFNRKVLEVLVRHLKQFVTWKERTYTEIISRRTFTLKYLKQHYEIIKMYMTWVRPYLRHVQRLSMREDKSLSADIVVAFENSLIDIEFLAYRNWFGHYNSVFLYTYHYRTHPSMKFVQEGYQRGPVHVGKLNLDMRAYIWTDEQIESYVKMKEQEDFELMKLVSGSVESAMDSLGAELKDYLEEAGKRDEIGIEVPKKSAFSFKTLLGPAKPKKAKKPKKVKIDKFTARKSKKMARKEIELKFYWAYKNFKKGHGFIQW
jgi:hypothetical protein